MKQEDIMKLEAAIAADYSNIAGMVVRKDGETVYERYFGGCTAESRLNVFSVTKKHRLDPARDRAGPGLPWKYRPAGPGIFPGIHAQAGRKDDPAHHDP